jgi:arabinose-5-phosphate isomerase
MEQKGAIFSENRLERMRATVRGEPEILEGAADALDAGACTAVDLLLGTQGHVFVAGAGTSNAVTRRFGHLLSCSGCPAAFLHAADCLQGALGTVAADDTIVLISKGGKTAEVNGLGAMARERGARIVAFTEAPESELGRMADCVVRVRVDPSSDPFGLVATSSSLANAAVADAICETILAESGYSLEVFAATHQFGAVGERIKAGKES